MSTTQLELDRELLAQAAAILGTTTKKATVKEHDHFRAQREAYPSVT